MSKYWLDRLKRVNPDLAIGVQTGELSLEAACIQAGIRKRRQCVPIDTPDNALRILNKTFDWDDLFNALMRMKD